MNLDKAKLEAWLDALVEAREVFIRPYDEELKSLEFVDYYKSILLTPYRLIPEIAETLGVEWYHGNDGTDYYAHKRWFVYKDMEFHALSKEEE